MSLAASVRLVLAPPHPAGHPFLAAGAVVFVLGLIAAHWLALARACCSCCSACISSATRSACRRRRPGLLLAPADGRVVTVAPAPPPPELGLGDGAALAGRDLPFGARRACQPRAGARHGDADRLPARPVPQRQPGQGQRATTSATRSAPPAGRARDGGGADRRADRAAHRVRRARGRRACAPASASASSASAAAPISICRRACGRWSRSGQTMIGGETVIAELAADERHDRCPHAQEPPARRSRRLRRRLRPRSRPRFKGPSFNRMVPNLLTMLGLCAGLTAIRFALEGRFGAAAIAIVVAAVHRRAGRAAGAAAEGDHAASAPSSTAWPTFSASASRRRSCSICGRCRRWRGYGYMPCAAVRGVHGAAAGALQRLARCRPASGLRLQLLHRRARRRPARGWRCSRCSLGLEAQLARLGVAAPRPRSSRRSARWC